MKSFSLITGAILLPWASLALAEDPPVPGDTPPASHYESLWTKSPFSVATPEEAAESPDYSLVGVTQLDGVAYASIVQKQNSDHFLISSEKENKGMLLKSITHSSTGSDTIATVEKDGQVLTLKLESAPVAPPAAPGAPGANGAPNAGITLVGQNMPAAPNIPMPGSTMTPPPGSSGPSSQRFMRIHRPTIHLPPQPGQNQPGGAPSPSPAAVPADGNAPTGANGQPGQPVQPHFTPPSQ